MKLKDLLNGLDILSATADMEAEITGVSYDSRSTAPGDVFVAISGEAVDGHRFIPMAAEKGAACVVCERVPEGNLPYVQVANSRRALALMGGNWFDHPAREMTMVGVTGTSGKTTSTYLIKSILEQKAGAKVGLVGTIQNMIGDQVLHTERTTPESFELHRLFRQMSDAGSGIRHPVRHRHLHQPQSGPSGLPSHHGGVLRRQGDPLRPLRRGHLQRRRSVA